MKKILAIPTLILASIYIVTAQLPYCYGFETADEQQNWTLCTHPDVEAAFAIGDAIHYLGEKSLYLSNDGGLTTSSKANRFSAYREMTLQPGTYDIAFDILVPYGRLRMGIVPESFTIETAYQPSWQSIPDSCIFVDADSIGWNQPQYEWYAPERLFRNLRHWTPIHGTFRIAGQGKYKIFFEYLSDSYELNYMWIYPHEQNTAVAIDNFQINRKGQDCTTVTDLAITSASDNIQLSWQGTATKYNLMWGKANDSTDTAVKRIDGVTSPYNIDTTSLREGIYSFRIQAVCGNDTGIWHDIEWFNLSKLAYFTSFEKDDDTAWHSSSAPNEAANLYTIGRYDHRIGSRSLYLSNNGGTDNAVDYLSWSHYTYRTFTLDTGTYEVLFDYKCPDYVIQVALAPVCEKFIPTDFWPSERIFPKHYPTQDNINIKLDILWGYTERTSLPVTDVWQKVRAVFHVDRRGEYNLLFESVYHQMRTNANRGPEIDNIQLTPMVAATDCRHVSDLKTTQTTEGTQLSWQGNGADGYEGLVYNISDSHDTTIYRYTTTEQKYTIPLYSLPEGLYSFRVSAMCDAGRGRYFECPDSMQFYAYTPMPYTTGFEPDDDNDSWVITTDDPDSPEPLRHNFHVAGTAHFYQGVQSTYISSDSGVSAAYPAGNPSLSVLTKNVILQRGTYRLSFYYRLPQDGVLATGMMPSDITIDAMDDFTSTFPTNNIKDRYILTDSLAPASEWTLHSGIVCAERDGIYSIWMEYLSRTTEASLGASIDNVQLEFISTDIQCSSTPISVPLTHLPYVTGFETTDDNHNWHIAPDYRIRSNWLIADRSHYIGKQSLYIAQNIEQNDSSYGYTSHSQNFMNVAYRTFHLRPGEYDLAFDYYCYNSQMCVGWAPADVDLNAQYGFDRFPPAQLESYVLKDDRYTNAFGVLQQESNGWWGIVNYENSGRTPFRITITEEGDYNLFFLHAGAKDNSYWDKLSIDNVQLAKAANDGDCIKIDYVDYATEQPKGFDLSWQAPNATRFQVLVHSTNSNHDTTVYIDDNISKMQHYISASSLPEGQWSYRVRACCSTDTGLWTPSSIIENHYIRNFHTEKTKDSLVVSWQSRVDDANIVIQYYYRDTVNHRYYEDYYLTHYEDWTYTNYYSDTIRGEHWSVPLDSLKIGEYDFDVSYIGTKQFPYTLYWSRRENKKHYIGLYDPLIHCFDFTDFYAQGTECWQGDFNTPLSWQGLTDNGYWDRYSVHTVHFKNGETDPRTGNRLTTSPPGRLGSVRINRFEERSSGAGALRYRYEVTPDAGVLLLRYALVLQDGAHAPNEQSVVDIRILDENLNLLDEQCSHVNFNASSEISGAGWHTYNPEPGVTELQMPIKWCDWNMVGINVDQYAGQTIVLELALRACVNNYHFGYGYFAIESMSSSMEGAVCGKAPERFEAPAGFDYRWYIRGDESKNPVCTTQVFLPSLVDIHDYAVDVMRKDDNACYYTLNAFMVPRIPHPDIDYKPAPADCKNAVTIANTSYVMKKDGSGALVPDPTTQSERFYWNCPDYHISNSTDSILTLPVSAEGDTFKIYLRNILGVCDTTAEFTIQVPTMPVFEHPVLDTVISDTDTLTIENKHYYTTGTYQDTLTSQYGCDSILTINLRVMKTVADTIYDTICQPLLPYIFYGREISTPGWHCDTVASTEYGCDSVYHRLHLTIQTNIDVTLNPDGNKYSVCADEAGLQVPYTTDEGTLSNYHIIYPDGTESAVYPVSPDNIYIPLPEYHSEESDSSILPPAETAGVQVVFHSAACVDIVREMQYEVHYPQQYARTLYLCGDETVTIDGRPYSELKTYRDTIPSAFGCDSVIVMHVRRMIPASDTITDTICFSDAPYIFHGREITASGKYEEHILSTSGKCDSIIHYLFLEVVQPTSVTFTVDPSDMVICADDDHITIDYTVTEGIADSYRVIYSPHMTDAGFDNPEETSAGQTGIITITMPPSDTDNPHNGMQYARPDQYHAQAIFHSPYCAPDTIPIDFTMRYPSAIIIQRWNDFLGICVPQQNGGYRFTDCQWLKDGQPIESHTFAQLYTPGKELDFNSEYTAILTRDDDNKSIPTCPLRPVREPDEKLNNFNVIFNSKAGETMYITTDRSATGHLYNTTGHLVNIYDFAIGETHVKAPDATGIYMLHVEFTDGTTDCIKITVYK